MTTATPFEEVLAEDFTEEQRRRIEKRTKELRAEYEQTVRRDSADGKAAKRAEPASGR